MPTEPKAPSTNELGHGGLLMLNNIVNTTEFNNDLKGQKGIKEFNKMRLVDATINAALMAIFLPILSTKWRLDPADETRKSQKAAEFVEWNLFEGMTKTWQETLQEVLLYLPFGVMPFELVWDFDKDGYLYIRKLASRWPTTIVNFDDDKNVMTQNVGLESVDIPFEKLVVFINQREGGSWWGRSVLRPAFQNYYIKSKYYLIDAMAHERQGLGIPYAKKPTGALERDVDKMEEILANIGANEEGRLIFPVDWEVGFMDMKAGTIKSPIEMIGHHDRQMLKNVLAQFIDLGASSTGSYALSEDHQKLFIQSLEAIANYIQANIQKYIINKIVAYNFPDTEPPVLSYEQIGDVDLAKWSEAMAKMMDKGVIEKDESVERISRSHLGLPQKEGGDFSQEEMDAMLLDLETDPEAGLDEVDEELDENGEPIVTEEEVTEAHENGIPGVIEAAKGQPLSDEHKRKISGALKRSKSKGGSGKKKKAKASDNPEVKAKKEKIKQIRQEMKDFARQVRKENLERRAKGEKLSDQDKAKKELEVFNKKTEFEQKIEKLQKEIDSVNTKPAPGKKEANEGSNPLLLKFGEQLNKVVHALTKRTHTS
jgi:hypothetical protein